MKTKLRHIIPALVTALAGFAASTPTSAQTPCVPRGVDFVTVGLLAAPSDPEVRREHIFLSDTLASQLGIGPYDSTSDLIFTPGADVNPQVRVIIESPTIDGRQSSAVFTVAGVFDALTDRIRVYRSLNSSDKDSGEFKLFKDVAPQNVDLTKTRINGDIANVEARVLISPVSTSTVEENGVVTEDRHYCEPSANGSNIFVERAVIDDDKRFALLVPHGGGIEVKTSDQISTILALVAGANLWEGRGTWGLAQTYSRWHITGSAIMPETFPALEELLSRDDFAAGVPFQYAVALHGYDLSGKGIIVGGRADREAKCLVVRRIQDELLTSRGDEEEIGFYIHDMEGNISIENSAGHTPTSSTDYSAQDEDEIVNRLSPNPLGLPGSGGIQIEQSAAVRTDETTIKEHWLRFVVARGVARAAGELIAGTAPADVCAQYLP
jgi:phage replication-related protein YjqB (UPF0714/DUF867 family)